MGFESKLPVGAKIITEANSHEFAKPIGPDGVSESGLIIRDYGAVPLGSQGRVTKMPREFLIPRVEWRERIEERERKGLRLIDRCERSGRFRLNQSPSWYCWCYSTTTAVMARCLQQNEPPRLLVPESVAGPIMNYRKQGGWCSLALKYMMEHGIADSSAWPWESHNQANRRQYFDPSRDNARLTIVEEAWDIEGEDEQMSCLLHGFPMGSCYDREGHARASIEPVYVNGQFGRIDIDSYPNSSDPFDTQVRLGRAAISSDTVAIVSVSPNSLPATA
jgi:hypothetical protein